ncbi:MAG: hypothetical protein ABI612_24255 [Betaproteobacteria bacterium]
MSTTHLYVPKLETKSATADTGSNGSKIECPLTGDAIRLMCKLEKKLSINGVADNFPRVLNHIADVWKRPSIADRYFEELLHGTRDAREGFPLSVLSEISALREYYLTHAYPKPEDVWGPAIQR